MALSNFYWDSAKPVDGTLIPDGPQAWRYVVGNNAALLGIEHHTFPTDSNSGAYHQPGSAVLLTGTTRPLTRLDTTAFDANDNGRLFFDTDTNTLEVLTAFGGPTWVSLASLIAANNFLGDFAINTNKFTVDAATGNTAVAGTLDVVGNIDPTSYETTNGGFLDENDMSSDSATAVASQQSIKAYVDAVDPADSYTPTAETGATNSTGVTVFPNGLRIAYGVESVGSGAEDTVTPSGFTNIYQVTCTLQEDDNTDKFAPKIGNINATTFTIRNTSGETLAFHWICIGR